MTLSGPMPVFAQPDPPLMVKLLSEHTRLPRRVTPGSAGLDLFAAAEVVVSPKERVKVPTDLAMAIPTGLYGPLAPRSSLALKYWLDVAGGVIDNDYRDHIQIIIANEGTSEYRVVPGDKPVAQILLNRYAVCDVVRRDSLDETNRKGGFGSTDGVSMADKNETAPGDPPRSTPRAVRTEACHAGYLLRVQEGRAWQDLLLSYCQFFSDMQVNQRAVRISHSEPTAGRSSAQLEFEAGLHSLACRFLWIVACLAHHYQSFLRGLGHLSTFVMLQFFAISSCVLGRVIAKPSLFLGLRATGIPGGLPVCLEHMVDHSLDVVLGQSNPADKSTVEVLDATLLALGLRYPEQCREVNNGLGQLSGRNHRKDSDDTAGWETNSEADSEGMSSEAVTDDECVGNSTNRYKPPCAPDYFMGGGGYSCVEQANLASSPPVAVTDRSSLMSMEADILKSFSPAKPVQFGATSSVKRLQAKVRHKPKWHAFASVARRGDLCLRPEVVQMVRDSCSEREIHIDLDVFSKNPPLALAPKTFSRALRGPLYKGWVGSTLWVLPPTGMYQTAVRKSFGGGCKRFMLLPTRKQHEWWWMMGEITIDWVHIPPTSEIFQTKDGIPLRTSPGEQYRLVYFDAVEQQQADIDLDEEEDQEFGVGVPVDETRVEPHPINPYGNSENISCGNKHQEWEPLGAFPVDQTIEDIQAQGTRGPCERGDQVRNPLYSRSIRSVIQGDEQYPGTEKYRQRIEEYFRGSVFTSKIGRDVTPAQLKARGEFGTVRLKEKKGAVAKSCKAVRAVGVSGNLLQEMVNEFINRGFVVACSDKMDWVSRAFLVLKPHGKWRLVIDYRWLNSQLGGYNFPLPVIEDQIAKQGGRFIFTLVDLEDGFHQMELAEESQPLTAFITLFGTYMSARGQVFGSNGLNGQGKGDLRIRGLSLKIPVLDLIR